MYKSARTRKNEALSSAPGFNSDIVYEHSSRVKSCCWQGKWFMSLDQQTLQLWGRDFMDPDRVEVHQKQLLPDSKSHFVSAVTHAAPMGPAAPIILAACLDHTLKVYSEKLRLRSSICWDAGTVTMMVYNPKHDTIITTGSAGVKLWVSTADTDAYAKEKALPASDRPWLDANGCIVPWCYGRFQTAKQQLAFEVSGLKTKITAADVAVPSAGNVSWCNMIQLLVPQQLLLVMFQADVYGFDAGDGSRLYSWRSLSQQPLVDMVYISAHQQLVTASREPTVVVRQLQQDGSLAWVRTLGRFAAGVHCVRAATGRPWLLTASLDGFVVAWNTENWQQLFRMKLPEAVSGVEFYKADHFFCLSGHQVKFFKLRQAAECWMELSSPLTSLEPLSYGLLLATFADSSIRLLDAGSTAADKAAPTTVPQLSSASLSAAVADLPGGRLFALLTSGHIHVWDLHLTRPPALTEVWTHLQQERCCIMAFMDGASMDPAIAKTLGLSIRGQSSADAAAGGTDGDTASASDAHQQQGQHCCCDASSSNSRLIVEDHVFVGTRKGEVLVCDCARQGLLVLRVPAIKLLPVSVLLLDLDLNRMVVGGGNVVKIWDLEELVCIAEFEGKSEFLCGHILEGRLLLGSACGRCYMLDLATGRPVAPPAAAVGAAMQPAAVAGGSDHDGAVMCVSGSCYLQHYVTASQDGYVKVFDRDRRLKASLYLATPLAAAAFLNDAGDILVAPVGAKHLMVVWASTYAVTPRTRRNEQDTSIFDDLRGRGAATPRTLLRNMTCSLQALATNQGPVPLTRYPAALAIGSAPASPTAASSSSSSSSSSSNRTPDGCNPALNPSTLPPWGLPSPSTLRPEISLQQPAVIQSSSRPPVDLDQNRVRAETARAMAPARVPHRLSTIGRAVQQQQQQQDAGQEQGLCDIVPAPSCGSVLSTISSTAAAAAAAAVGGGVVAGAPVALQNGHSAPAGPAAAVSRLGRMARGAAQQEQQQQQEQQLIPASTVDAVKGPLWMTWQQQQGQQGSLPLLKQLPAAFAGLTVSAEDSQQQLAATVSAVATPGLLPSIGSGAASPAAADGARGDHGVRRSPLGALGATSSSIFTSLSPQASAATAAAAAKAGASICNNSRRKHSGKPMFGSSSSTGRWNTTIDYNLKALEMERWKKELKNTHGASSSSDGSGSSGSGSDVEEDESDDADDGSSSSGSESGSAVQRVDRGLEGLADSASKGLHQLLLQKGADGNAAAGEMFRVGQLNIKVPKGSVAGLPGPQQQKQQDCGSSTHSNSKAACQLDGLQGSMRQTVALVEDPDVFMEDVPVPCELQELLDRYHAEMAAGASKKVRKKKGKMKKVKQQWGSAGGADVAGAVIAAGAYGTWEGAQGIVQDPAAAAVKTKEAKKSSKKKPTAGGLRSSSSGSKKQQKEKKLTYTSALDYLMHTVSDPAVLIELKEAESHDSRQTALARQWLSVGSGKQSTAVGDGPLSRKKGVPFISTSGSVQRLLDSMSKGAQQQQHVQPHDGDGILCLDGVA